MLDIRQKNSIGDDIFYAVKCSDTQRAKEYVLLKLNESEKISKHDVIQLLNYEIQNSKWSKDGEKRSIKTMFTNNYKIISTGQQPIGNPIFFSLMV